MGKVERRLELLRAARDVFATKGYHDAKVDDIVARAKVAKGTFYLYFRDKRSVFEELVDGLFARLGAAILRVDVDTDIDAQVKHNIRAVVAVLLDDPTVTQLLLSHGGGVDPAFAAKVRSFYDGANLLLREAIREGQTLGIIAEGDPAFLATFTIGGLKELLLEHAQAAAPPSRERIVADLFSMLESGYLRMKKPAGEGERVAATGARAPKAARRASAAKGAAQAAGATRPTARRRA
jgi:AcrR family transcriptional regulator